jgi:2-polyprenyl-3-methyl-5-hydroxy-6-metoxy-1,4-benzoquinol methylase
MSVYSTQFYFDIEEGSKRGAPAVLGLVTDWITPKTVVDVGCGTGIWLSILAKHGAKVTGIDGNHVATSRLLIDPNEFITQNLEDPPPGSPGLI